MLAIRFADATSPKTTFATPFCRFALASGKGRDTAVFPPFVCGNATCGRHANSGHRQPFGATDASGSNGIARARPESPPHSYWRAARQVHRRDRKEPGQTL